MIRFLFYSLIFLWLFSCKKESLEPNNSPIVKVLDPNIKITFYKNVKIILETHCAPCHQPGGDRINKWDTFSKTKTFITNIVERVDKAKNEDGFMPKNGTKLSSIEIETLKKWVSDGLLEN